MSFLWKARRRLLDEPHVAAVVDLVKYWRRYGTTRPTRLRFAHSGNILYVDRTEVRGRNLLVCGADGQPETKAVWHSAIEAFRPSIVVDVGLNYGEFLFDAAYSPDATLVGIEANVALRPWIERSAREHPNFAQMRLEFALACDKPSATRPFYIDPSYSGRGSGVKRPGLSSTVEAKVSGITVDSLFSALPDDELAPRRLLFKIDVEGFEPQVMRGMRRLLSVCAECVGILEFNSTLIRSGGVDPVSFLSEMAEAFPTAFMRIHKSVRRVSWQALISDADNVHGLDTDLVLASSPAVAKAIGLAIE
jgi:FkbM family methyltransferase